MRRTLESVAAQTVTPALWIVVATAPSTRRAFRSSG